MHILPQRNPRSCTVSQPSGDCGLEEIKKVSVLACLMYAIVLEAAVKYRSFKELLKR